MGKCTYKKRFPDMPGDMPGCRETAICPFNDPEESCAYYVEESEWKQVEIAARKALEEITMLQDENRELKAEKRQLQGEIQVLKSAIRILKHNEASDD